MNANDLNTALLNFAKTDLRIARKNGSLMVTQTVHGNLALRYDRDSKTYTLTTCGRTAYNRTRDGVSIDLVSGKLSVVATALAACYTVEG